MSINFGMWLTALQKPVKMSEKKDWDALDLVSKWLIATRGTVTQLTLFAGIIAGLLAWHSGRPFNQLTWLVIVFGLYMAHSTENLINDYIDFTRGIDEDNYYRAQYGIHPLVHKFWTKNDWLRWFLAGGILATLAGIFTLFYTRTADGAFNPVVVGLFIFGAAMIPFYAWPLKYWGLGELLIFLNWGMVLIPGVYTILVGSVTLELANVVLAGMAFGFGFGSFNWGKHIDKIVADKKKGVGTLPVRLGEPASRYVNIATILLSYAVVLYLIFVAHFFTPIALVVFLAAGKAWHVIKLLSQPRPTEAPPGFALWPRWFSTPQLMHIRLFGSLYIFSLFADTVLRIYLPNFWR
jgi:1,4-dihydroxy-2-naphthoate octaprenyltransferase